MHHRWLRAFGLPLAVLLALRAPLPALAWRNGLPGDGDEFGTHDWVLTEADRLAREGGVTWLDTEVARLATDDPDSVFNDRYHHQYDIWGETTGGDAPAWIARLFAVAGRQRAVGDIKGASRTVGLLAHYFADIHNPVHTDDLPSELGMHAAYELDAQLRTDVPGENRSWVVPDGLVAETDPESAAIAAATTAHASYADLVSRYNAYGFDAQVEAITRAQLNRAVNGLADVIAGIGHSSRPPLAAERLAGPTRYETAVEISRRSFPAGASAVVVATGEDWPDGLAAAPLAACYEAPLLLVRRDSVPAPVSDEIARLRPDRIVVLGSERAVSAAVEGMLSAIAPVERLGGTDRYATAGLVAEQVRSRAPTWTGEVFVATGLDFPDALAASPVAASRRMPILLTRPDSLPPDTALSIAATGARRAYVLGGERAVGAGVARALDSICATPHARIAGADRYATCRAVADQALSGWGLSARYLGLATGEAFPDALAGAVMLGRSGQVLLLTPPKRLVSHAGGFLDANGVAVERISVFGGEGAISAGVADAGLRAAAGAGAP